MRRGKLPLGGGCHSLLGLPDFTHSLAEGEVFIVVAGQHLRPLSLAVQDGDAGAGDDVIVYRPPGVRANDARKAKCVYCHALAEDLFGKGRGSGMAPESGRASAIYFSTRGETPLADLLAGGETAEETRTQGRLCSHEHPVLRPGDVSVLGSAMHLVCMQVTWTAIDSTRSSAETCSTFACRASRLL